MIQTWFECKVKYAKVSQNGSEGLVTESFLFDSVSYTDAEARVTKQMMECVKGGEFKIVSISKSQIAEVFAQHDGECWYKAVINLVTIDEAAGREKKMRAAYLLKADCFTDAVKNLEDCLSFMVIPYIIQSLAISPIVEVFPYDLDAAAAEMQKAN